MGSCMVHSLWLEIVKQNHNNIITLSNKLFTFTKIRTLARLKHVLLTGQID